MTSGIVLKRPKAGSKKSLPPKKVPLRRDIFFRRIPELFPLAALLQSLPLGRLRGGRAAQKLGQTYPHVGKGPGRDRSQAGLQGPAVSVSGEFLRIMYAGSDQHTVRHKWVINKDSTRPERGVKLYADCKDDEPPGGWSKRIVGHCRAFERDLSKLAKDKANEIMHAKRETAKRKRIPQKGVRLGADNSISCPVLAAIGTKTRG